MTVRTLKALLSTLPDEATLPVRWIRERLEDEEPGAPELLTQTQAAEMAGKSTATIRRWEREGKIRNYGRPHAPRYRRDELLNGAAPTDWEMRLIDARS